MKGGGSQDLYKDIFDSFDVDKNGYLSVRELGTLTYFTIIEVYLNFDVN